MTSRVKTFLGWMVIATIFVALGGLSAHAQSVPSHDNVGQIMQGKLPFAVDESAIPTMVDGAWVLPDRNVGNASGGGGNSSDYEAMIYATCASKGCYTSPEYMISVMNCESGGDHGALAYNPVSGNYTYGIFQIDGMWGGGGMSPQEQIDFAAAHLGNDIWWACQ